MLLCCSVLIIYQKESITYLKPKNTNCSHNQDRASISTMLGNAKPKKLAKLITPPLSGKSLLIKTKKYRTENNKNKTPIKNFTQGMIQMTDNRGDTAQPALYHRLTVQTERKKNCNYVKFTTVCSE